MKSERRPLGQNLDDDVHVSSYAWKNLIWRKTRTQRRALLRQRAAWPVNAFVLAAVELQRLWRGILLRRRVLAKYLQKSFKRLWRSRDEAARAAYHSLPAPLDTAFLPCLKRLQARLRTCLLRREYVRWVAFDAYRIYGDAAVVVQRAWLRYKATRQPRKTHKREWVTERDASAARIQNAWKSYVNGQIFRFYVELIKFRERGDPQVMLKCVNPSEASLVDGASGLHVRFRLGGAAFPPTIFYKIFCHGPVTDLGYFAPKDYTLARKRAAAGTVHNKNLNETQKALYSTIQ
ncbi:hypothetical protein DIPPA_12500, partial [Diplonema papillatum]